MVCLICDKTSTERIVELGCEHDIITLDANILSSAKFLRIFIVAMWHNRRNYYHKNICIWYNLSFIYEHWTCDMHYSDVIMGASKITSLTIVYSTVYSGGDQRKHQRRPVNSPHKWPVTRKMLPFHDVIMFIVFISHCISHCWQSCNE